MKIEEIMARAIARFQDERLELCLTEDQILQSSNDYIPQVNAALSALKEAGFEVVSADYLQELCSMADKALHGDEIYRAAFAAEEEDDV